MDSKTGISECSVCGDALQKSLDKCSEQMARVENFLLLTKTEQRGRRMELISATKSLDAALKSLSRFRKNPPCPGCKCELRGYQESDSIVNRLCDLKIRNEDSEQPKEDDPD